MMMCRTKIGGRRSSNGSRHSLARASRISRHSLARASRISRIVHRHADMPTSSLPTTRPCKRTSRLQQDHFSSAALVLLLLGLVGSSCILGRHERGCRGALLSSHGPLLHPSVSRGAAVFQLRASGLFCRRHGEGSMAAEDHDESMCRRRVWT